MNENIQEVNHQLLEAIRAASSLNYDQRHNLLDLVAKGDTETAADLLHAWAG